MDREIPVNYPTLLTVSGHALLVDGSDMGVRKAIHRLHALGRVMEQVASGFGELNAISGVQHQSLTAVQRLQGSRGVPVVEVAEYLRRSGTFVTLESTKLARRGLLEKRSDAADGRRVLLRLTGEGHRLLTDLSPSKRIINDLLFESLDRDKFQQLSDLLDVLLPNAEQAAGMLELLNKDRKRTKPAAAPQAEAKKRAM